MKIGSILVPLLGWVVLPIGVTPAMPVPHWYNTCNNNAWGMSRIEVHMQQYLFLFPRHAGIFNVEFAPARYTPPYADIGGIASHMYGYGHNNKNTTK